MTVFSPATATLGEEIRESSALNLLKRVFRDLSKYKLQVILAAVSIIAYTLTGMAVPYVLGIIIDNYILKGDMAGITTMSCIYLLLLLGQWISMTANTYYIQTVGQLYLRDLRNKVFSKLQRLSMRFFTSRRIGDLVSATINDTSTLNDVLVSGILSVLGHLLSLIGVVAIMAYINPLMTAVALANIPLLVTIAKVFGSRLKEAHKVVRKKIAETTMLVEESIAGLPTIKAFSMEDRVLKVFSGISSETARAFIGVAKLMGLFWPFMDLTVTLSIVLVLAFGGYLVSIGATTIGMVVAFIQYVNRLARPITQFVNMYDSLQAALAAAERIYAILDSKDIEQEELEAVELRNPRGEIELRSITFSYIPGRIILKGINIHVKPGEIVAVVGSTGAGKTTLVNLILRFYDPNKGEILLDGINIRKLRLDSLRKVVSYVPQETYLFPGSILDNIRLGNPSASDEEVIATCKKLGIHEFIERLPDSYMTDAGEMGKKLSTGEKQLIAIARAMLRNPAVVILDEALSSVDVVTEAMLRRAIRKLMEGRTGIIIAHRLSTVKNSDRIIVIENGRIIEEGTHEELMKARGRYYELYKSMSKALTSMPFASSK